MFSISMKLSNVEYFQVKYGFEVIKLRNGEYLFNRETLQGYKYVGLHSNNFICRKTDDYYFVENTVSGKILKLDASKSYSIGGDFFENGTFYDINSNFDEKVIKFRRDFYYHNFKTSEEKLLIKQGIGYFFDIYDNSTKGLFRSINKLSSLSLLTGEYEWEVDLGGRKCVSASKKPPEDASIQQIIGIWEHQLLVFLDNNQILSLDINKGKILWELPDFDVYFPTGPSVAKAMHFHWHLENGKLYILKHHQYFSVDLNTQEVALLWQNEDKTYTINHCTYTEDYIYFTAYGKEIEISILGVFNRKTLQIDWLEKMIMPRMDSYAYVSFHQAPQVADNKLYALDSGGTLHIFEREG